MDLIVSILVFTVWALCAVQFALSVQLSDGCDDPQRSVLEVVNVTRGADPQTIEIVEFYLECDQDPNPLLNETDTVLRQLRSLNETILEVVSASSICGIQNESAILYDDYTRTLTDLKAAEKILECDDIHDSFLAISSDVCSDGVNQWTLLYGAQMAVLVALTVSKCCVCTKKRRQSLYQMENDEPMFVEVASSRKGSQIVDELPDELGQSMNRSLDNRNRFGSEGIDRTHFGDDDVRKCLKYLLVNCKDCDASELDERADELTQSGYDGKPLNRDLVRKSMSIFKNYRANEDSAFIHPLMKGLVYKV